MTKRERKLVIQIARLCEKQYRKGFQHGFYACKDEKIKHKSEVNEFRQSGESEEYRHYKDIHTGEVGGIKRIVDRIDTEVLMPRMTELQMLFFNYLNN